MNAIEFLSPLLAGMASLSELGWTGFGLIGEESKGLFEYFSEFGYLAPFTVLLLCGFGFPVPEEVTMLGSGFLLYQGRVEALPVMGVCFVATLMGDSVPYWLGRHWGQRALTYKIVRRVLHAERLRALEERFERNGVRAVFVCRFLPGLRLPAWFTAGTLGMSYPRFIATDAAGAAIMTPIFVFLGYASGEKIAELQETVENLHQILGFVILGLLIAFSVHIYFGGRGPKGDPQDEAAPTVEPGVRDDMVDGDRP